MKYITFTDLKNMTLAAKNELWSSAGMLDREPKIYLHYTAGHYAYGDESQMYLDHYHIAIDQDGKMYNEYSLDTVLQHTWKRNTGAIGLTLTCGYNSGSNSLGPEPNTAAQIETMAKAISIIADALGITIDKNHVMTHGEAANNEDGDWSCHNPYSWWNDSYEDGDTRGDLEFLGTSESPRYNPYATDGSRGGDVLRGKANWYLNNV